MPEESASNAPSKWDLVDYLSYILPSTTDIRYAPSMKHQAPPIVTRDEIQNAKDLCPHSMAGCKLLEINPSTILKVGYTVHMGEAEALHLLQNRTSILVPRLLNAYIIEDIGFIVMGKIPGTPLEKCWEDLSSHAKRSIVQQLHGFIQEWRKIEGPYFGSVDGGPCEDVFFKHPWEWNPKPRRYGPFSTRNEFNQAVVEALCNSRPNGKLTEKDEPLAESILASGKDGQGDRKVFTYGDLHQSNIIVEDNTITGIIDWRELISSIGEAEEYEFWAEVNQSMVEYTGL